MRQLAILAIAALLASLTPNASIAQNQKVEPTSVQTFKGQYTYRTIDEHRYRGIEDWILHIYRDGARTMTSTVDNVDADVQFQMVQRVAKNFRPIEAFVTHWVKGQSRGSSHVVVTGNTLTATVTGPSPAVQTIDVGDSFTVQPHPVSVDGWRGAFYDHGETGEQISLNFNISVAPQATYPLHGTLEEETIEFIGHETITVPAGTFDVAHYKFRGRADMWLMPEHRIVVRYAYFDQAREYLLTQFSDSP